MSIEEDYIRRYLNDIETNIETGPEVNLDIETDSEFSQYIRRYLNDKETVD